MNHRPPALEEEEEEESISSRIGASHLRPTYPDTSATGGLACGSRGPAEGGPAVLLPPRRRLAGVPGGAVGADGVEVPVVLLWVVQVVRGADVGRLLRHGRRRRGGAEEGGHRERPRAGDHHRRRCHGYSLHRNEVVAHARWCAFKLWWWYGSYIIYS